jgi:transcriptional regulator with XRE-family HTH domain
VKVLRQARGLKQEALAEALGYRSRVSVSHIETGREDLPLGKVLALAAALEVPPAALFEVPLAPEPAVLPVPLQHLVERWLSSTEADRQTLQRCTDVLASGEADLRRHLTEQARLMAELIEDRHRKRGPDGAGTAKDSLAG